MNAAFHKLQELIGAAEDWPFLFLCGVSMEWAAVQFTILRLPAKARVTIQEIRKFAF